MDNDTYQSCVLQLPFSLLTHCALCGKAFSLVKQEVEFQVGMGFKVNPREVQRTMTDYEVSCNC